MRRALGMGAPLLVYPGGDHESYRPSWEANQVDFDGRHGFIRLALELGVRIVPIAAIGGQETALFLGRGRRFAKALKLPELARLKVLPVQLAPPFGLTVLDLPLRVPLPAKIKLEVLEPIDLRDELGPEPDPCDGYHLVTGRLQDALDGLAAERTLPVLG
jgi:1-acyl-sn-glycerol-3-phosphate acyltransferase